MFFALQLLFTQSATFVENTNGKSNLMMKLDKAFIEIGFSLLLTNKAKFTRLNCDFISLRHDSLLYDITENATLSDF